MLSIKEMKQLLEKSLPYKRYKHSVAVYETAMKLAESHGLPSEKIGIAALLHDCGREIPTGELLQEAMRLELDIDDIEANQPILLHAKLGVYYAKEKYGVTDEEILQSIRLHTTGNKDMTPADMIVYLADLLEPTRNFAGIEAMRRLANENLEQAMLKAYAQTINYLLEYDLLVHPHCLDGYNQIAKKFKRQKRSAWEKKG